MTETELADAIIRDALLLQRVAANDQRQADAILDRLAKELRQLLATELSADSQRKLNAMIAEAEKIIATGYGDLSQVVDTQEIADIIAGHSSQAIGAVLQVDARLATPERLASLTKDVLIEGAPTSAWWAKQSEDTAFRFAQQVRQGVINGETQERIVARVVGRGAEPGVLDISRRHARTLVHSSVMSAANQARLATFRKNSRFLRGVKWLATLDSNTCPSCGLLDGKRWDLEGKPIDGTKVTFEAPPKHVSCRCVLTGIPRTFRELGLDSDEPEVGSRVSSSGPVKADMTFEAFLKRQSPAFVERSLGKGRAELFLSGKLTLRDLVSATGRPLTLDQLRAR